MRATTTTCWGLAVGLTFLLPATPFPHTSATGGQTAPKPPAPVWQRDLDPSARVSVAAGTSVVFLQSAATTLEALAADDGRTLWTRGTVAPADLVAADDGLFVISVGGIEAIGSDGITRWRQTLPDGPTLAAWGAGLLAVSVGADLFVIDDAGWRRGPIPLGAPPRLPPLVTSDFAVLALADGRLLALDRATGRTAWSAVTTSEPLGLAAHADRIYVTEADGTLLCRTARDGRLEWPFSLYALAAGPPRLDDRHTYVALFDNTVQAIDRTSGSRRWRQELSGRPAGTWLMADGRLLVAQADGVLLLLSAENGAPTTRLAGPADGATRLEAAGAVPGPKATIFTVTTDTSATRRLSLWQPTP